MSSVSSTTTPSATRRRVRFELIFASVWIGVGLLILPALIYWIGVILLGPYGENAGLGAFYVNYFRDLAEPTARAWALLLGPLATISVLRLIFRWPAKARTEPPAPEEPVQPPGRRVEPRLGD